MSLPLVLITGATGYVGSHVLQAALDAGYPVRITSRPKKVEAVRARYGSKVDVVVLEDVGKDDFTEALKGVGAIIHLASPLAGRESNADAINTAVNGNLNILRQAAQAGVARFIMTSSVAAAVDVADPASIYKDCTITAEDWNPITKEQGMDESTDTLLAYEASKTLAEQEVWKFADAHPEIDVTTINPPYIYGPFVPGTKFAKGDIIALSTMGLIYKFVMSGEKLEALQMPFAPTMIDVRDVAKAHILALTAPTSVTIHKRKRLLIWSANVFWSDAVEHLSSVRPDLKPRLSDSSAVQKPAAVCNVDTSLAAEVLGLKGYIDWRKTIEDAVDALLEVERSWGG